MKAKYQVCNCLIDSALTQLKLEEMMSEDSEDFQEMQVLPASFNRREYPDDSRHSVGNIITALDPDFVLIYTWLLILTFLALFLDIFMLWCG